MKNRNTNRNRNRNRNRGSYAWFGCLLSRFVDSLLRLSARAFNSPFGQPAALTAARKKQRPMRGSNCNGDLMVEPHSVNLKLSEEGTWSIPVVAQNIVPSRALCVIPGVGVGVGVGEGWVVPVIVPVDPCECTDFCFFRPPPPPSSSGLGLGLLSTTQHTTSHTQQIDALASRR